MVENAVLNLVSKVSRAIEKNDFFFVEMKRIVDLMKWVGVFLCVGVCVLMGFGMVLDFVHHVFVKLFE